MHNQSMRPACAPAGEPSLSTRVTSQGWAPMSLAACWAGLAVVALRAILQRFKTQVANDMMSAKREAENHHGDILAGPMMMQDAEAKGQPIFWHSWHMGAFRKPR